MFVGVPKVLLDSWTHNVKHSMQLPIIISHVSITTKVQMSSSSGKMLYTLKIQWLKSEWPSTKQLLVKERIYIYIFGVMSNSTATHIWSDLI